MADPPKKEIELVHHQVMAARAQAIEQTELSIGRSLTEHELAVFKSAYNQGVSLAIERFLKWYEKNQ